MSERNITQYTFEQDGTAYYMTEIHPKSSQHSTNKEMKKVFWTHKLGMGNIDTFLKETVVTFAKKRVFLLTKKSGVVLIGFLPKLTKRERGIMDSLAEKINKKLDGLDKDSESVVSSTS